MNEKLIVCKKAMIFGISGDILSSYKRNVDIDIGRYDDVIKWKYFRVTGPLWGEFTGHRWIPRTEASDAELWYFLWSTPG